MSDIISFTIKNFRSLRDKTEFTFEANESDALPGTFHYVKLNNGEKVRLLNTAVVFGANAAGKSNLIWALYAFSSFVNSSRKNDPNDNIRYEPFAFSPSTENAPIEFSLDFVANGNRLVYEFSYNNQLFLSERLFFYGHTNSIFTRHQDGKISYDEDYLPDTIETEYLTTHLVLSELALKPISVIQDAYKSITSIRTIITNVKAYSDKSLSYVAKEIINDKGGEFSSKLKELIIDADTGIVNFGVQEHKDEDFQFPNSFPDILRKKLIADNRYEINLAHRTETGSSKELPFEDESAGSRTLFVTGARAIRTLLDGGFLAYDEMNIALHPLLFRRIVALFNNEETNPKHAQLMTTTHDSVLIDERMLRADQVWFVEKDSNGSSSVYSADDFAELSIDEPIGPWYRSGQLGARPNLKYFDTFSLK